MNNSFDEKNKSLNCGFTIKVLSIIALICDVISLISFRFDIGLMYFRFSLAGTLLNLAPFVLAVLYFFKPYNAFNARFSLLFVFLLLPFNLCKSLIDFTPYELVSIGFILMLVPFTLSIIGMLTDFKKNTFIRIAMLIYLLFEAFFLVNLFLRREFLIFESPISLIGDTLLYITLLLFATKNRIPKLISVSAKKKNAESTNPEQALKVLKYKLDFGMITDEEYQAQRVESISKL